MSDPVPSVTLPVPAAVQTERTAVQVFLFRLVATLVTIAGTWVHAHLQLPTAFAWLAEYSPALFALLHLVTFGACIYASFWIVSKYEWAKAKLIALLGKAEKS